MRSVTPFILFSLMLVAEPAIAAERPWYLSLNLNHTTYDTGDIDANGSQTLGYTQVSYRQPTWGAGFTSAYAATRYQTEGAGGEYDLSAFTDIAFTSYYMPKIGLGKLRVGIDMSLPTGKSSLSTEQLGYSLVDDLQSDLLLLRSYGGGTNIAPHLSWSYHRGSLVWGVGARYLFTGKYDPTTDLAGDDYDSGDRATLVASLLYNAGTGGTILGTLHRVFNSADTQRGENIFRNGDEIKAELRWRRQWDRTLNTNIGLIYERQDPNQRQIGGDVLQTETGNSNSNVVRLFVESAYRYSRHYSFTGVVGYTSVASNSFASENPLYDGGRTKIYIEPGVVFRFSNNLLFTSKVRGSFLSDKTDAYSSSNASYRLLQIDLGLIHRF